MGGFRVRHVVTLLAGVLWLVTHSGTVSGQVFDRIVGKAGTDPYKTIQAALNSVPDNSTQRTLIFVKNGLYQEKVALAASKINVSLIGENVEGVIITWDDYQGKNGLSGANSYTFLAEGNGFYAENVTIRNAAGPVGQAVAIRTTGDEMVFKNCRFLGHQDTYYAHKKRQFNLECLVEGTTDFIYGDATTIFRRCTLNCLKGGSYISAPADTKLTSTTPSGKFYHGLLFDSCMVTAETGVAEKSYYLGRPWQPDASSVFIRCTLHPHIKSEGWSVWGSTNNHLTGRYAEYGNLRPDGSPVDVSQRVSWSKQLSEQDAASYYTLAYFLKKDGVPWDPLPMTTALPSPENLFFDADRMNWQTVAGARGYVIFRNDSCVGFSITPDFRAGSLFEGNNLWTVKSVSVSGTLSIASNPFLITFSDQTIKHKIPLIRHENGVVYFSENADVMVTTLSGQVILNRQDVREIKLKKSFDGILVVTVKTRKGIIGVKKIFD